MNRVFLPHPGHFNMDIILPPPGLQAFCPTDLNVRALPEVARYTPVLLSKLCSHSVLSWQIFNATGLTALLVQEHGSLHNCEQPSPSYLCLHTRIVTLVTPRGKDLSNFKT